MTLCVILFFSRLLFATMFIGVVEVLLQYFITVDSSGMVSHYYN